MVLKFWALRRRTQNFAVRSLMNRSGKDFRNEDMSGALGFHIFPLWSWLSKINCAYGGWTNFQPLWNEKLHLCQLFSCRLGNLSLNYHQICAKRVQTQFLLHKSWKFVHPPYDAMYFRRRCDLLTVCDTKIRKKKKQLKNHSLYTEKKVLVWTEPQ